MGCGSSSQPAVVVHQNGAAKPAQSVQPYPQAQPPRQAAAAPPPQPQPPPPQPQPPPQSQPKPDGSQQPTTGEVAQEQSPSNPPKPPSPPAEHAPKTDQALRNPGAPPPAPDDEAKSKEVDNKDAEDGKAVSIKKEDLTHFIEFELRIRELEKSQCEERLGTSEVQLNSLQTALKNAESNLTVLRQNTEKEKRDVVEFNIAQYMMQHGMSMMAPEDALKKEQQEYIDAKNKQDVAEKQIEGLHSQINKFKNETEELRRQALELKDLRQKVDGLLENIFNDEYGSELEARLELESEQLLALKQHISVAHYKWHNGKNLIHHACLQFAFAKRRWEQIKNVNPQYLQARYQMVVEVRSNLIAAHQNVQQTKDYLKTKFQYFNDEDIKNLLATINSIFVDVLTVPAYERALAWYQYFHYRSALLLNWMDQTINNKIVNDHKKVTRQYYDKYKQLRAERFRCIKERAKQDLNIDLDLGELEREDTEERITSDVTAKDSDMALMVEASAAAAATSEEEEKPDEEKPPPPPDSQENAMDIPEPPEKNDAGPPQQDAVPLSDLAPPPSSEELFGNIEELKEMHKQQIEEFEKAQSLNKTRMDQGLQEKLRARRSKRIKQKLHQEQSEALTKKKDEAVEEPVMPVEDKPLGGDGNQAVLNAADENNN